jgi:uncharacterized membrane protein YjjP (DUF1212 family)
VGSSRELAAAAAAAAIGGPAADCSSAAAAVVVATVIVVSLLCCAVRTLMMLAWVTGWSRSSKVCCRCLMDWTADLLWGWGSSNECKTSDRERQDV